ncbi:MAG: biotin transporter BioY [Anaerolineae bacterium]|nr:biotin transporter BioY [Anaerolineae bacterium]
MTVQNSYSPSFLAEAVWPRPSIARDVALVVGGSLLLALIAQIQIPLYPVPITGATFGVLLIGALLGSRRGALAMLTYLGWGALGLPVFANAASGVATFFGPTAGYLVGYVPAAFLVGWLCERGWDRSLWLAAVAMLLGNIVIYACGIYWLAGLVGWDRVLPLGLYPFIPGDILKIALAAWALPTGWKWINRSGR